MEILYKVHNVRLFKITLALAYMLYHLFVVWLQLQMMEQSLKRVMLWLKLQSKNVKIEDDGLSFYFIFFHSPFIFSYFLLKSRRQRRQNVTKCDTVTSPITWSQKSHAHIICENNKKILKRWCYNNMWNAYWSSGKCMVFRVG